MRVGQRLPNPSELRVQAVFEHAMIQNHLTHPFQLIKRIIDYLLSGVKRP
ncbi:hypothetical protein NITHO_1020017 [Nitrolancea hollandica Lb]|uniref:Uncharacterized protein n=1 Tax=Nitrolancea hollandica Lb TaxID=1129897 RepID=I4ECC5_9BACT|nr:hypothetical protein NITHO_1020017 [Nitrolancea hollandica Lb]